MACYVSYINNSYISHNYYPVEIVAISINIGKAIFELRNFPIGRLTVKNYKGEFIKGKYPNRIYGYDSEYVDYYINPVNYNPREVTLYNCYNDPFTEVLGTLQFEIDGHWNYYLCDKTSLVLTPIIDPKSRLPHNEWPEYYRYLEVNYKPNLLLCTSALSFDIESMTLTSKTYHDDLSRTIDETNLTGNFLPTSILSEVYEPDDVNKHGQRVDTYSFEYSGAQPYEVRRGWRLYIGSVCVRESFMFCYRPVNRCAFSFAKQLFRSCSLDYDGMFTIITVDHYGSPKYYTAPFVNEDLKVGNIPNSAIILVPGKRSLKLSTDPTNTRTNLEVI